MCVTATYNDQDASVDFIKRLRAKPWARNSFFVYVVESNYGGVSRSAAFLRALCKHRPCFAMSEDIEGKDRPGIWVTHDYKERFVQHWNSLLDEDLLFFHDDIVSKHPDPEGMMIEQQRNFRRQYSKEAKTDGHTQEPKIPFKYTGKGKGKTDDWMMSALEGAYFMKEFFRNKSYMNRFGHLPMSGTGHSSGQLIVDERGLSAAQWIPTKYIPSGNRGRATISQQFM